MSMKYKKVKTNIYFSRVSNVKNSRDTPWNIHWVTPTREEGRGRNVFKGKNQKFKFSYFSSQSVKRNLTIGCPLELEREKDDEEKQDLKEELE